MTDPLTEWRAAVRGVVPDARPCADVTDIAFWLFAFARAAGTPPTGSRHNQQPGNSTP